VDLGRAPGTQDHLGERLELSGRLPGRTRELQVGLHGISTGPAVCSTTIVRGFAFATAAISAFWSPGNRSDGRSIPSLETSLAKTIATLAPRAARGLAVVKARAGKGSRTLTLRWGGGHFGSVYVNIGSD
jgi:hypothetical protein